MPQHTSNHPLTGDHLRRILAAAMPGADISVRDDTHKHARHNHDVGHHGAHFYVRIVWDGFAALDRLERHRRVHLLLAEPWVRGQIHSLSLRLAAPREHRDW